MRLFRSDGERAAAGAAKALLDKMPAHVRREVMRGLSADDAAAVREAAAAVGREQAARNAEPADRSGWWTNPKNT